MDAHGSPPDLFEFPLDYEFKVFGPADEVFRRDLLEAVRRVFPLSEHALRERTSSGANYRCITILVRVQSREQMEQIYVQIRKVKGLKYLL